ncbi:hypothetical protein [Xanthobacter tagetidis]|uniref:Uncharacterized protein n=1 Tax=Xanthobacter tagetidis TaxID=60216 RepID=A0A3L6ZZW4_9HYPH|nr:hypothetical protein [Xanthobacter tagetidis]MBB6309481.1 hypothetical protein [Xanthobacter tagetidis]RLP73593.1 hypothetical protein D9R14_20235 [Xanthobacter tagetidis]
MAEVTNELLYEVLKPIQREVSLLREGQAQAREEMIARRSHVHAIQQDVNNIYGILARHDARLDRIERRLDLVGTH